MVTRLLKMDDYQRVYDLWHNTPGMGIRSLDDSRDGIEVFIKRNPATCFVLEDKDGIHGTILCGHDGRRGYIYHTAVEDGYRGKGLGRDLVYSAINALKEEGITKVALVVYKNNDLGNGFWEKMGFTLRGDLNYRNFVLNEDNI